MSKKVSAKMSSDCWFAISFATIIQVVYESILSSGMWC